jgi:hypothetical protein
LGELAATLQQEGLRPIQGVMDLLHTQQCGRRLRDGGVGGSTLPPGPQLVEGAPLGVDLGRQTRCLLTKFRGRLGESFGLRRLYLWNGHWHVVHRIVIR